ncbi:hypothetical protein BACCAP_00307 [Pseudoflavonifractor capillosus ATCC 29799]|uniref:Uncharacterized protein n=1 Tax=Pseudoflavonifractor capillosus ATCC 29799 TaxID=411467 RepID=A6NQ38_9FIRM|nr:hypothetical protein BACCAP_00307 [Pseudoflavonifractor capillosus ATCC 29799]
MVLFLLNKSPKGIVLEIGFSVFRLPPWEEICIHVYQMSTNITFSAIRQDVSQKSAVFLSFISTERGVIRP